MNNAAFASTFYIDFDGGSDSYTSTQAQSKATPWKYCPGMGNATGNSASYSVQAGDIFIFKGGVQWDITSTWTLSSGTSGNIITYTVDPTWYTGSSWSRPVIDGNNGFTGSSDYFVQAYSVHHWKLNNLQLSNVGSKTAYNFSSVIKMLEAYEVEISYCRIIAYTAHAINFATQGTTARNGFSVHHNEISNYGNGIEFRADNGNGSQDITGLTIHDNVFHDGHCYSTGDHYDTIHLFSVNNYKQIKNIEIYNNIWYGSWENATATAAGGTAQIYLEDCVDGGIIYNNVHSFSNHVSNSTLQDFTFSPGFCAIYGSNNVKVYNNTYDSSAATTPRDGASGSVTVNGSTNIVIKNNIDIKTYQGIYASTSSNVIAIDGNMRDMGESTYYGRLGTFSYSLSDWNSRSQVGTDYENNPELADMTAIPPDYTITNISPAYDKGVTLSEFSTDIEGTTRPQGSAWDIGAYEYDSGSATATIQRATSGAGMSFQ